MHMPAVAPGAPRRLLARDGGSRDDDRRAGSTAAPEARGRHGHRGWLFSLLLAALLLTVLVPASATEQIPDAILVDGQERPLYSEPFGMLLDTPAHWKHFREASGIGRRGPCTANWRGYRAWWSLQDDRLWLQRMVYGACNADAPAADLSLYFPGQSAPVAADWYSGTLVVPLGERGVDRHMGYSAQYPRYRLVEISAGRITAQREIDHAQLMDWRRSQRRSDAAP
ncbi:hypothetical protein [Xanthomonas sp. XNM01]|uniref:hypothetical protein n=1 Tax=Xanthomonas sp. XNM01 TaxID=2769289 RepID=UPI0017821E91|nr:hypothetical protein [Xanthomonas sp. XNM01]MBD9369855.1 hypothetical protein [Xanthomonas sp. XNM01]